MAAGMERGEEWEERRLAVESAFLGDVNRLLGAREEGAEGSGGKEAEEEAVGEMGRWTQSVGVFNVAGGDGALDYEWRAELTLTWSSGEPSAEQVAECDRALVALRSLMVEGGWKPSSEGTSGPGLVWRGKRVEVWSRLQGQRGAWSLPQAVEDFVLVTEVSNAVRKAIAAVVKEEFQAAKDEAREVVREGDEEYWAEVTKSFKRRVFNGRPRESSLHPERRPLFGKEWQKGKNPEAVKKLRGVVERYVEGRLEDVQEMTLVKKYRARMVLLWMYASLPQAHAVRGVDTTDEEEALDDWPKPDLNVLLNLLQELPVLGSEHVHAHEVREEVEERIASLCTKHGGDWAKIADELQSTLQQDRGAGGRDVRLLPDVLERLGAPYLLSLLPCEHERAEMWAACSREDAERIWRDLTLERLRDASRCWRLSVSSMKRDVRAAREFRNRTMHSRAAGEAEQEAMEAVLGRFRAVLREKDTPGRAEALRHLQDVLGEDGRLLVDALRDRARTMIGPGRGATDEVVVSTAELVWPVEKRVLTQDGVEIDEKCWKLRGGDGKDVSVGNLTWQMSSNIVVFVDYEASHGVVVERSSESDGATEVVDTFTLSDCRGGLVRLVPRLKDLGAPKLAGSVAVVHGGEAADVDLSIPVDFSACTPHWFRDVLKAYYSRSKVRMSLSETERELGELFHEVVLIDRVTSEDEEVFEDATAGVGVSASQDSILDHTRDPHPRVVIEGEAGVGKTTVLRRIAWGWAGQGGAELEWVRVKYPWVVFLRLSTLGRLDLGPNMVAEWLFTELRSVFRTLRLPGSADDSEATRKRLAERVWDLMESEGVLILADGLDELHRSTLRESDAARSVWTWLCERDDVILTTRPSELREFKPSDSASFTLVGLTRASQEAFVRGYVRTERGDVERGEALIRALQTHRALRLLAPVPVILEVLCDQFVHVGRVADFESLAKSPRVYPIYRRAVSNMYARFGVKEGIRHTAPGMVDDVLELDGSGSGFLGAVHAFYADLAWAAWSGSESSGKGVDGKVVLAVWKRHRDSLIRAGVMQGRDDEADAAIVLQQVGLLRKVALDRPELLHDKVDWEFHHRSLMEYLAAERFVEETEAVLAGVPAKGVLGGMRAPLPMGRKWLKAWWTADSRSGAQFDKLCVGDVQASRVWSFVVGGLSRRGSEAGTAFAMGLVMHLGVDDRRVEGWISALAELPDAVLGSEERVSRYLPAGLRVVDAMFAACRVGVWAMVRVCGELLAPEGLASKDARGATLLHDAVDRRDHEAVQWLLSVAKLPQDIRDIDGGDPWYNLHLIRGDEAFLAWTYRNDDSGVFVLFESEWPKSPLGRALLRAGAGERSDLRLPIPLPESTIPYRRSARQREGSAAKWWEFDLRHRRIAVKHIFDEVIASQKLSPLAKLELLDLRPGPCRIRIAGGAATITFALMNDSNFASGRWVFVDRINANSSTSSDSSSA